MRIHRDDIWVRIGGGLFGLGLCAVGIHAMTMPPATLEAAADRSSWMGFSLNIVGIGCFLVSWLVKDLSGIWCRPMRLRSKK